MKNMTLQWPEESARPVPANHYSWHDHSANRVLDFHGDPANAGLSILSDGNHHMALAASLQIFLKQHPDLNDIFYVTLPPQTLNGILEHQHIHLANLKINVRPDIYLGPLSVLNHWHEKKRLGVPHVFARSQGQAWLVRKGNPTQFRGLEDFQSTGNRLFISNPVSEKTSHRVYRDTLLDYAQDIGLDKDNIAQALSTESEHVMHSRHVHHREAPQALVNGQADIAIVYYHLALRYTRIFPDNFSMLPLHGSGTSDVASYQELTEYAIASINGCCARSQDFIHFLRGSVAGECYRHHGLWHSSQ